MRVWPYLSVDDVGILIVTPTLTGHDGLSCLARQFVAAATVWNAEGLNVWDAEGVDVIALANASSGVWPAEVRVTDCGGSRAGFVWRTLAAARGPARPSAVVVLHAHLLPAVWPLVVRGTPLVPVLVGVEAWQPLSWGQRRVLAYAERAIAISHHTAAEFRRANPRFDTLTIDVCWPATPPLAAAATVAPPRTRFALIVSRLSSEDRYKGHDQLIEVWPSVLASHPDARLVVAGTGDDQARLSAKAAAAGVGEAIEFVGRQSPADLAALYRDCAFLVMPSRHEGFGYVFLEAMTAGRACIGARGAAEEIIVANESGLIVDPDRREDLRDALVRLFADPDLCERFGEVGRRRAAEVFAVDRFQREVAAHLNRYAPAAMVRTPC